MLGQKLFQRIPSGTQEIDIGSLTSEFKDGFVTLSESVRGNDSDLVITFDSFGEEDEFWRVDQSGKLGVGWDM